MKKLLAIVISMAMIVAMMPVGVFAVTTDNCAAENCSHQAAIGTTHYDTLQEAVDAVGTNNETEIRLLNDIESNSNIIIEGGRKIKLDLNKHNISVVNSTIRIYQGTLNVIGEGTIQEKYPNFAPIIIQSKAEENQTDYCNVIIGKDITLIGWAGLFITPKVSITEPYAYGVNIEFAGKIKAKADTNGYGGHGIYINGQIKHIDNATNITVDKDAVIESEAGNGIYAAGYANWNLAGNINALYALSLKSGTFNITGGKYHATGEYADPAEANGNGSENTGAALSLTSNDGYAKKLDVTVTGGTFISDNGYAVYEGIAKNGDKPAAEKSYATLDIKDGTFIGNTEKGTVNISTAENKEIISGGTFSDLNALNYLGESANVTIKLGKDATKDVAIPAGCTATIDLNGNKITNSSSHTIVNSGTLTIEDTSENKTGIVDNVTHGKAALVNYGTAILNEGIYTRSLETKENNKNDAKGNSFYTILNDKGGNMTIKDGVTVTNIGHFSSMIRNGGDENSTDVSKLQINGGNFSGGLNTVKNDELGELTVTGGSFSNTSQYVIMNWHKANLSGGRFEANDSAEAVLFTAKYAENRAVGELAVTGGTYVCKDNQKVICNQYNSGEYTGNANITGGTYSLDPSDYVVSGYYAAKNSDGTYTVYRYVPSATDNVTNNTTDKNTTADLTPAVKDNKAETTVDAKTADKIVEKALENKSEEIIVDAAGNNTVASSEVGIPEKTVKEIAEKTDANLVIKTDNGKVDLDKAAVKAVADQAGTTGTVKLIVETVKNDADICHVNLKLVTSNGAVTDFKGGNVKVTINLTKELAAKELVCVYIDDNGIYTLVDGVLNADGTYTFTTGHFSEYAVMAKAEADKKIAEQLNTLIKEVNLKVRTSKTAKKNIKAVVSGDVKAITDAGYTVKYKFYRSEKKASKYEAKATKAGKTYINTAGKKGTKYYYKAKALVYDGDKLVGQTVLTQCKYGVRTWSK